MRSGHRLPVTRRRWETPDGDFVDLDLLPAEPGAPRVLVLHGLEASSKAGYIAEVFRQACLRRWQAIGLNFRSCNGEPNRLATSYHSGSTADALFVARKLREAAPGPLTAIGFSLGGNILLRLLGETGDAAPIDAAVAISVPYDLQTCLEKSRRFPQLFDRRAIRSASRIEAFDEAVTAPLNGFASATHYYAQCSSGPILNRIRRPTLLLNAKDDPLAPSPVPPEALTNPNLTVVATEKGGHVGFVSGSLFRPRYWAEQQAMDFLSRYTASS